jgi:hypothetical protein
LDHADFRLAAAGKAGAREERFFISSTDDSQLSAGRTEVLRGRPDAEQACKHGRAGRAQP